MNPLPTDISLAFSRTVCPSVKEWLHPACRYNDSNLKLLRRFTDWRSIPDKVIEQAYDVLPFTSAKAYVFVLPAYLKWALKHARVNDVPPVDDYTIYSLNPLLKNGKISAFKESFYTLITQAQSAVIIRWLEHLLENESDFIHGSQAKIALRYWRNRSQP